MLATDLPVTDQAAKRSLVGRILATAQRSAVPQLPCVHLSSYTIRLHPVNGTFDPRPTALCLMFLLAVEMQFDTY